MVLGLIVLSSQRCILEIDTGSIGADRVCCLEESGPLAGWNTDLQCGRHWETDAVNDEYRRVVA